MNIEEVIKQRIAGHIAFRTSLMTVNMVLIGALSILFINLNLNNIKEIIIFIIGILSEIAIFLLTVEINKDLEKMYKKLEE